MDTPEDAVTSATQRLTSYYTSRGYTADQSEKLAAASVAHIRSSSTTEEARAKIITELQAIGLPTIQRRRRSHV